MKIQRLKYFVLVLGLLLTSSLVNCSSNTPPNQSPSDFALLEMISGLNFPVAFIMVPDGRIFFNEYPTGKMRVISPDWELQKDPVYEFDIAFGGEAGLLGIAAHPDFEKNGWIYVFYTASLPTRNVISRISVSVGLGIKETIIVDNLPAGSFHNGGNIHFGPDGLLYVSIGDNGNSANSQDLMSLAGKILRYNPDGSIPKDNPFVGDPEARDEIYAYGLRNSFNFTFHHETGDLWATENGPNNNDEINLILPGENYGWPIVGGIANNPLFMDPILAYTPTIAPTGIISISNTSNYPKEYHNNLFFLAFKDGGSIYQIALAKPSLQELESSDLLFLGDFGGLLHAVEGSDGFIYVSSVSGGIYRLILNN